MKKLYLLLITLLVTISCYSQDFKKLRSNDKFAIVNNGDTISKWYAWICYFNCGTVRVLDGEVNEDGSYSGKYGIIDSSGKEIVPCKYDFIFEIGAKYSNIKSHKGDYVYYNINNFDYIINAEKASTEYSNDFLLTGYIHDSLRKTYNGRFFDVYDEFVPGSGKYGCVNNNGKEIIACEYDYIAPSYKDIIKVFKGKLNDDGSPKKGFYGFYDISGNIIAPCTLKYDKVFYPYEDYLIINSKNNWGVLKLNGEIYIKPKYSYSKMFYEFAMLLFYENKYKTAYPILQKFESGYEDYSFNEDNELYPEFLSNLAYTEWMLGKTHMASIHYRDAQNSALNEENEKSILKYAEMGLKYSEFLITTNDYRNAEVTLYDIKVNLEEYDLLYSFEYAEMLRMYANLYNSTGNYILAEKYAKQALVLAENSKFLKQQNYDEFVQTYAEILSEKGGNRQSQLANLYRADSLFSVALEFNTKNKNDYSIIYYTIWQSMMRYDIAQLTDDKINSLNILTQVESVLSSNIDLIKTTFGENDPTYASSVQLQALVKIGLAKYLNKSAALKEYLVVLGKMQEATEIYKLVYGGDNSNVDYLQSLNNEALLHFIISNNNPELSESELKIAKQIFDNVIKYTYDYVFENFSFMSEKEKELFFATLNNRFEGFYSYALKSKFLKPENTADVYNTILKNKGLILKSSTALKNQVYENGDPDLISKYEEWLKMKDKLAQINLAANQNDNFKNNEDKRIVDTEELNNLEKEIVQSVSINSLERLKDIKWENIKNDLDSNEAAIEFIHFNLWNRGFTDSTIYCALIVKAESQYPEMIPLFEEKQLLLLIDKETSGSYSFVKKLYGEDSKLYDLIWKPLEGSLKGVKTIYLSPTGLLHKISFPAICKKQNIHLCDNYNINTQSTTGKVHAPENSAIDTNLTADIYGGINYNTDSTKTEIWNYLDGTLTETQIINFFLEDKKIKTNYFTDTEASENTFKTSSSECNILHLATHGFFYPSREEEKKEISKSEIPSRSSNSGFGVYQFVKNKNPLMRSGLVLAGANEVWEKQYSFNNEDGVLTALEVSNIDLRRTQLVVLSACETGLGDIRGTEGVYGLQRAFKMAGAKFLIMSLWEVPDKETEEFMTTFYSKLLNLKDIKQAFSQTQREMRAKYDPYFWAAFVLIE
ncbi:MAG: CHAT domain-containing protein [Saprospiraceae bacterium]|nr:CHAT domain-containing protein [Saprospiraceae bacterium]